MESSFVLHYLRSMSQVYDTTHPSLTIMRMYVLILRRASNATVDVRNDATKRDFACLGGMTLSPLDIAGLAGVGKQIIDSCIMYVPGFAAVVLQVWSRHPRVLSSSIFNVGLSC